MDERKAQSQKEVGQFGAKPDFAEDSQFVPIPHATHLLSWLADRSFPVGIPWPLLFPTIYTSITAQMEPLKKESTSFPTS